MELGLREWLIIGGVIVVLLIVLDGWRRMRGNGNRLKMKIDKSLTDLPEVVEESSFNPELPGGGARVANSHGETRADSRREPTFATDTPVAKAEPSFNKLDLSPVRKVAAETQASAPEKAKLDSAFESTLKPELKKEAFKPAASKGTPVTSPVARHNGSASVANQSEQAEYSIPSLLTPDVADENDPLFAPADSFPPHHDGPSFDEMDEGVSAARVVRTSEPEIPVEMTIAEPSVDDSASTLDESDVVDDVPMIQSIVQPEPEPEPEPVPLVRPVEAKHQPDIDDMFSAEPVVEHNRSASYSVEEDDLIDSLPDGFRLDTREDTAVDEDEHEFDYTRPVSELMRPKRDDNHQLQQTMMDLPEHQDQTAPLREAESSARPKTAYTQPLEPAHFSAIDDDEQTELTGLFTDDQPVAAPAPAAKPIPQSPAAKAKETVDADSKADPAIGIKGQSLQKIPEADKVLVISVVATEGEQSFSGRSLLQILLACGMRYGDMKIFHRYEDGIDKGAIQFSMTNALEPGYFDIETMDSIETRGVTFFMSMEEPRDVMNAYECMLATASAVATNLNGVLLDENRSTMRDQTKEHYRERIRKFEMRKLKKTTTA
nr:cell division protein ZipA [uncultured Amphritea sp.]